ncbi:MAG: hypothetical protein F6J94_09725, partial [Moorea sp. SIO1F2]|nr:hypothetical protein [Moorena sp. SIO1F2]
SGVGSRESGVGSRGSVGSVGKWGDSQMKLMFNRVSAKNWYNLKP